MASDSEIHGILQRARAIAIVGMSAQPDRPSHAVARFLQRNDYQIIPVNPSLAAPVLGVAPVASLRDLHTHVDIVAIFRRAELVDTAVDDAIAIGADAVWMPLGVVNTAAAARARAAGLDVIMDRCLAIEHRRLNRYAELALA